MERFLTGDDPHAEDKRRRKLAPFIVFLPFAATAGAIGFFEIRHKDASEMASAQPITSLGDPSETSKQAGGSELAERPNFDTPTASPKDTKAGGGRDQKADKARASGPPPDPVFLGPVAETPDDEVLEVPQKAEASLAGTLPTPSPQLEDFTLGPEEDTETTRKDGPLPQLVGMEIRQALSDEDREAESSEAIASPAGGTPVTVPFKIDETSDDKTATVTPGQPEETSPATPPAAEPAIAETDSTQRPNKAAPPRTNILEAETVLQTPAGGSTEPLPTLTLERQPQEPGEEPIGSEPIEAIEASEPVERVNMGGARKTPSDPISEGLAEVPSAAASPLRPAPQELPEAEPGPLAQSPDAVDNPPVVLASLAPGIDIAGEAARDATEPAAPPAPSPVPPSPTDRMLTGAPWVVQLLAVEDEVVLCDYWADLKASHPELFGEAERTIARKDLGNGRIVFRLRAGSFETRAEAVDYCKALGQAGQDCFPVHRTE